MINYLRLLESLEPTGFLIHPAESRAVILTGQSSLPNSDLNPDQRAFLASVVPEGCEIVLAGFPYHQALLTTNYTQPGMLAASLRNTVQTIWTAFPRFRGILRATLQRILDLTREQLWLLTGSCGLQMANAVWPELRIPKDLSVNVVAVGPVCFAPLQLHGAQVTVVQGIQDHWSRLMYRGQVHIRIPCRHMEYWSSAHSRECISHLLRHRSPVT